MLTIYSTYFAYGYIVSDIWLRTTQLERKPAATISWVILSNQKQGSYKCTIPLAGMRNNSGPP